MELTVLGSGSFALPRGARKKVRNPAGYAVRLRGGILLFDLGFGNVRQLARAGLDPSAVTDAFFTHRHPDHTADLAALLFLFRYDAAPRAGKVRLWGPPGFRAFVKKLSRAYDPWLTPRGYRLEIRELRDGSRAEGAGWRVDCLSVRHSTPTLAYRLSSGARSLVYSGDTGPARRLPDFARGCGLFLLEATLGEGESHPGHLNPRQALAAFRASGARKGLFTHLSLASERGLRRLLKPGSRARLARDLMVVRVEPSRVVS